MRFVPIIALAALSGCAATITAPRTPCTALIPTEWRKGVEGAELPQGDTVADWIIFGDRQTGQLGKANGRTLDAISIIEGCEARDRQAVRRRGLFG